MKKKLNDLPPPLAPKDRYLGLSNPIFALTGGISSGKTTALKQFKAMGFETLSADEIVKELYQNPEIVKKVNKEVLKEQTNAIDFKKLRSLLADDPMVKEQLEVIIHPLVQANIQQKIMEIDKHPIIYEIPLLFEKKLHDHFDLVILVSIQENIQTERLTKRDKTSKEEAVKMITLQLPNDYKVKHADIIIENDRDPQHFQREVNSAGKLLLEWFHHYLPTD